MQIKASDLSAMLNGTVEGDPDVLISRPSKIEEGGEGTITFLGNPKYESYIYSTTASVVLVSKDFTPSQPVNATLIRVDDVYNSIAFLLDQFGAQMNQGPSGISDHALVNEAAKIGEGVSIGAFSIISKNASIGANTLIHDQVFVGEGVEIGSNCVLHPGVKIYHACKIGNNCTIHSNSVIGADGFGFAPQGDGTFKKVSQIGNVVMEDNVDVGSNVTIDRATMGSTFIKQGVKIDNLVQIAHNVVVGENTVIAAQAGVAGSTKIGKNCMIGGQVGFAGHLEIADGTKIQAQSGLASSVKEKGQALFGSPAIPYNDYIKSYAVFKKLPALYRKLGALEKEIQELKEK
ncbi:MAG: UDP-3-O-(3-hydroxymyristoyl)glucosamine N-acyltransferase [Saprospiraceae bacterium]|nr:UDP-3-O-(3-hydroxymyristoyl)glucosamine N-acyltransferase [Saprospiraceae bacterium]